MLTTSEELDLNSTLKLSIKRYIDSKQQITFLCDECDFKSTIKYIFKQHKMSMHEGLRYPCDECNHKFTRPSSLKQHKQSIHEGIEYLCDQCNFKASYQSNLTNET